jgi:hypothetical protein
MIDNEKEVRILKEAIMIYSKVGLSLDSQSLG